MREWQKTFNIYTYKNVYSLVVKNVELPESVLQFIYFFLQLSDLFLHIFIFIHQVLAQILRSLQFWSELLLVPVPFSSERLRIYFLLEFPYFRQQTSLLLRERWVLLTTQLT